MRTITLAATAALLLAATGCSSDTDADADGNAGSSTASSAPEAAAEDDSEDTAGAEHLDDVKITKSGVEDHETWGPGAYVVHYKVTNHGDDAASYYAGLEFLDSDGDVLGTTGITADKLGAGKSKSGDTSPLPVEIENGEITDIKDVRVSEVDRTDPE